MRFQVPQYIDVEDKIGFLTFKQYLYVGGAIGLSVVVYSFVPNIILKAILIIPILVFGAALAFYKHNNRPFIFFVESFFYYLIGNKLYIWKKRERELEKQKIVKENEDELINIPKVSQSNIRDLSLHLDMKEEEERISDRL